jgi:hypothetical protein
MTKRERLFIAVWIFSLSLPLNVLIWGAVILQVGWPSGYDLDAARARLAELEKVKPPLHIPWSVGGSGTGTPDNEALEKKKAEERNYHEARSRVSRLKSAIASEERRRSRAAMRPLALGLIALALGGFVLWGFALKWYLAEKPT